MAAWRRSGGQRFLTRGLQQERAGRTVTVGYLHIVFAAAWGVVLFAEIPGVGSILGGLLIVPPRAHHRGAAGWVTARRRASRYPRGGRVRGGQREPGPGRACTICN